MCSHLSVNQRIICDGEWQWQDPAAIAGKPGPWSQFALSVHPHSHVRCPTEYRDCRNLENWCFIFYSCVSGNLAGENMLNKGFLKNWSFSNISFSFSKEFRFWIVWHITFENWDWHQWIGCWKNIEYRVYKTWSISYSFIDIIHPFICIC